jgi:hypothetical protein
LRLPGGAVWIVFGKGQWHEVPMLITLPQD